MISMDELAVRFPSARIRNCLFVFTASDGYWLSALLSARSTLAAAQIISSWHLLAHGLAAYSDFWHSCWRITSSVPRLVEKTTGMLAEVSFGARVLSYQQHAVLFCGVDGVCVFARFCEERMAW